MKQTNYVRAENGRLLGIITNVVCDSCGALEFVGGPIEGAIVSIHLPCAWGAYINSHNLIVNLCPECTRKMNAVQAVGS